MDHVPPDRRSFIMRMVKTSDTKPELAVRKLLHGMGFRFRLRNNHLPGKPDVVLPRWRAVVLIHGCFWHRHRGCRKATTPKTKTAYWLKKFQENVRRDRIVTRRLESLGWRVCVVWQCELRTPTTLGRRLREFLKRTKTVRAHEIKGRRRVRS
jgi:DNA mismatch endonuclease (patch repair protein)